MSAASDVILKLLLVGEDKSASAALGKVGDKAKQTGDETKRHLGGISSAMGALGGIAAAAGIVEFGKESIAAFTDAAESQAKLEFAYGKFPAMANVNIDSLRSLNAELQRKTGIDGDDTAAAQASLAAYGLTGAQIQKLTPLMQDYAAKTGKDMTTAADDMGKAMLGSGKALKSVGVDFVDAKSVGGNFDQVMAGLTSTVGGTAEAMGETAAGKSKILAVQFGDLQEMVGEKLMPVMLKITDVGIKVVEWITQNSDELQPYVIALGAAAVAFGVLNVVMAANPISLIIIGIAALAAGLIYAYQHSETFRNIVDTAFKAIGAAATWLWNNAIQPFIVFMIEGFANVGRWIGNMLEWLGRIPGFEWAADASKKIKDTADKVENLTDKIKKIPPTAKVEIEVSANYSALQATALAAARANIKLSHMPGYATGGRPKVGEMATFGEDGVELWVPDQAGTVYNASQTASMLGGPSGIGGGGGNMYVSINVAPDADPLNIGRVIEKHLTLLSSSRGGSLNFLPRV